MWIKNTDKEVECFHPICKNALERALDKLQLADVYEVQHHRHVGPIEMDLVVANKTTNKILCVIEVKRTIAAVNSTRYQYQAMSYVQSLSEAELEGKYYILTNLECSCLFKFDQNRPNVYEQIIEPGICINHLFSEVSKDNFLTDLIEQYTNYISIIVNDKGIYLLSFKKFADEVKDKIDIDLEWKKTLIGLFYEYIRGAFTKINRPIPKTILQLSNKVDLICQEGQKINFKDIFTLPELTNNDRNLNINRDLLQQLFELGKTYVDADELTNVMHKIISERHKHEGEVPTDTELATLMIWLVKSITGELNQNEKIMDPAAGSGSLLCAAINVFENIQPSQIIANDINDKLLQLLSLRIGLKFASTIERSNTAKITTKNIAELSLADFNNVRIVVLNPPYLAATAVNCFNRKKVLYNRIRQLKGNEPTTLSGQMPLEGPFLELIINLVNDGTVMAVILPNTHLTTKGEASKAIRTLLLNEFGLRLIFNYPQETLFEGVLQNTSIIIGVKGSEVDEVRYLYCNEVVSEVNGSNIANILSTNFTEELMNINNQFEGCRLTKVRLEEMLEQGWQIGNMTKQDAQNFIKTNIATSNYLTKLSMSEYDDISRGKIGNNGCTDLLFMKPNNSFLFEAENLLKGHLAAGFNNSKFDDFYIGEGDSLFFNVEGMTDIQIKKIVDTFFARERRKSKKQRRDNKLSDDYVRILKKESLLVSPAYCVVLPRSIRLRGRVFVSSIPTYISTNFFVIKSDEERSKLLASWFSTIYFQLECEAYGNNRKGLRKLEKEDYEPLHVPITTRLSVEQKHRIISTQINEFVNLRSPKPREIDKIWGEILFGENVNMMIEEVTTLISILAADREK